MLSEPDASVENVTMDPPYGGLKLVWSRDAQQRAQVAYSVRPPAAMEKAGKKDACVIAVVSCAGLVPMVWVAHAALHWMRVL